jgi:hypothetical protein
MNPNILRPRIRASPIPSPDTVVPIEVVGEPSQLMMGNSPEFRKNFLRVREGERSRGDMRHDSKR